MHTILICLLIAMLLPYAAKVPVAMAMAKLGRYDNNHPRAQQAQLTGFGARAVAGHQNAFESLIVFGVAVLTALVTNNVTDVVALLAIVHVVARVVYHVLYLLDYSTMRSLSWFVAIGASIAIFCQAF
ncbi:MAPEG family protein [Shewanella inventionis]|uniref:Membrane protein n=1 Tax=Shewanella inventionis TaxID=1738770 RepID=A0ABQ1JFI8_9GAMM|nr:MAPEG family protein [Shewanella inventionis]MCL1159552.1 MAPEG family protein [Shewanella inventionis]UAL44601.1 MAPEG family protein [Shewanella inventionis]GGB67655.1 membrane protein [Shewanella inventionis]